MQNKFSVSLPHILSIIIVVFAFMEAGYGVFQIFGFCRSLHPDYALTGHFYNPGPFGCFLALAFPIVLRWMVSTKKGIIKIFGTLMVIIVSILVSFSMSRTGLAACIVGGVVAISDRISHLKKTVSTGISIAVISVVLITAAGNYFIKKDSADGRFLIWKIAVESIADSPFDGVGWDKVAGVYGEAQEEYFSSGKGSEHERLIADAPHYIFNEYLQVALAFGLTTSLVMVLTMTVGIVSAWRSEKLGLAGAGVSMAIVMSASYPLQFPLFVVTMALIVIAEYLCSNAPIIRICGVALVTTLCTLFFLNNDAFDVNTRFLEGKSLRHTGKYRESNDILVGLLPYTSDPMPLNLIGRNFQDLNLPDSAEYYYRKSINRCPNRLYPHYLLMMMYADSAFYNPTGMTTEADRILTTKEKISSPAIDEMKSKAKEILDTYKTTGH